MDFNINEVVTGICMLILSGLAVILYLMKNAPLEENCFTDYQPEGKERLFFSVVTPTLFVVLGLIFFAGLYNWVV